MKIIVVTTRPAQRSWVMESPQMMALNGDKFSAPGGPPNVNGENWNQAVQTAGDIKPQSQYQTPLKAVGMLNL